MNPNEQVIVADRQFIESCFSIVDKQSNNIPFLYNPVQAKVESKLKTDPHRKVINIVVKSRKQGCSSLFLAKFTKRCITNQNTKAVVISHEKKATQRLLARTYHYLDNLPVKVPLDTASTDEVGFPETHSSYWIGTAGSRAFGRGDDINLLHISELDFWENPEVLTGVIEACVDSALIIIETTGNGYGSKTHQMVERAMQGLADFNVIFVGWNESPEYYITPPDDFKALDKPDIFGVVETELQEKYKLTDGQLYWRREKLRNMDDPALFPQEFPINIHEAFLSADQPLLVIPYQFVEHCIQAENNQRGDKRVVIACDTARFGDDETVIYVVDTGAIIDEVILKKANEFDIVARIQMLMEDYKAGLIAIDTIGAGGGVVTIAKRLIGDDIVVGFNSSEKPEEAAPGVESSYSFYNKRSEAWWNARRMFRDNRVSIPNDIELIKQITNIRYKIQNGKILIEPKEDIKKANRLGRSPDIEILDHIVLGDAQYYSFREHGLI